MNDVQLFVKSLRIKGVFGLYLFGSVVNGKAKPYSDIDVCVIGDHKVKSKVIGLARGNIDLVWFDDLPLHFQFRVFKEGKPLLIQDRLYVRRLMSQTIRRYLDFQPTLQRHIQRVLS